MTAPAPDILSESTGKRRWGVFSAISAIFSRIKTFFMFQKKKQPLLEQEISEGGIEIVQVPETKDGNELKETGQGENGKEGVDQV